MLIRILILLSVALLACLAAEATTANTADAAPVSFCPYNCSGHGKCDEQSGVCQCTAPFNGPACAYRLFDLVSGTPMEVVSDAKEWVYFDISVPSSINYISTTITHSQGCSPDLFSRADDIPDLSAYDYAILDSKDPEIQLNIVNPLAGTWYFGVVSNNGNCSFDITVGLQTICPNNCSGHGQCDTASGRCICEEHWKTNQDCSLKIQNMQLGEIYYGTSDVNRFIYYKLSLSIGNRIEVGLTITQSNTSLNVDPFGEISSEAYNLFVGYGFMPDLTVYDYVARTVFEPPHELITAVINNPIAGDIYIGVYSRFKFDYQISSHSSYVCPNQCSNSGQCTSTGTCICGLYYRREDCSLFVMGPLLIPGTPMPVQDSILGYYWRFFNVTVTSSKDLTFSLSASEEMLPYFEMYILPINIPSTEHYTFLVQCSDPEYVTAGHSCGTTLYRLDPNYWVIGVRLNTTSTEQVPYSLGISAQRGCPNDCNSRGTCTSQGICDCHNNWSGDDCSIYESPLPNSIHQRTRGRIAIGEPSPWRFFSIDVTDENTLILQMNRTGPISVNGTLLKVHTAMYVRKSYKPTLLEYTRLKTRTSVHPELMQITMQGNDLPSPASYFVGVYIHDDSGTLPTGTEVDFWISGRWDRICPRNCSKQGTCVNGQCVCNPPYIPPDCSAQNLPIPTYLELKGKVAYDVWNYYQLTVLGEDALEVIVQEQESIIAGRVWVFLKLGGFPTIDDNDGYNQSTSVMHTVFIPSTKARGNWTIGVTGSPRNSGSNPYTSAAEYTILALTGCGTYSDCGKCVVDPNCGWCRNEPFNPAAGQCVPGTPLQPLNQTCLYYNFNTCDVENSGAATVRGLVIGVAIGAVLLLGIGAAIFFVWRDQRRQDKEYMRPVVIDAPQNSGGNGSPVAPVAAAAPALDLDPILNPTARAINFSSEERQTSTPRARTNYGSIQSRSKLVRNTPEGYASIGKSSGFYTDEEEDDFYGEYVSSDSEGDDQHHGKTGSPAFNRRI